LKTEFLRPRLVGKRFDEHSIPVEVLKDWVAFESLVLQVARWMYLEQSPQRRRTPRGFSRHFALHLSRVEDGSAVLILERPLPHGSLVHDEFSVWFERARDRILDTIQAASRGQAVDELLPKAFMSSFDQFGRSLQEEERVEFIRPTMPDDVVVYDHRVRRTLVLESSAEYRTEESVRGAMTELNLENRSFTLRLVSGEKVTGFFGEELRESALDALEGYGDHLVLVEGAMVRDRNDNRRRIEDVTRIEPLDPLDVPARLEALALLRDGWMDGRGTRPSPSGLAWLSRSWTECWPDDVSLPHVYPTPEGGVQFEWSVPGGSISAEVNLDTRVAEILVSRTSDGEILVEARHELDRTDQWQRFAALVQHYVAEPGGLR
jgi:hypothetical protein